jgi:DNA-binding IclR family transcriptional regulator
LGKALLAWLPEDEARSVLSTSDRPVFSTNLDAMDRFFAELADVRRQHYAVDNEEDAPGMRCVGAPIFDHAGRVVAAISLTAPVQRMPLENIPEVGTLIVESAGRISQRLGFAVKIPNQVSSG